MTEAEWLDGTDPEPMLDYLLGKSSDRKFRLFGCACCRQHWNWLPLEECKQAVTEAEHFADGKITREQLTRARKEARWALHRVPDEQTYAASAAARILRVRAAPAARQAAEFMRKQRAVWTPVPKAFRGRVLEFSEQEAAKAAWDEASADVERKEGKLQASLLRDIFGNPFRPLTANPSCLTPNVLNLAQVLYEKRAFCRLPELADSLSSAGCGNAEFLAHCREPQGHVLGCWVVDLLLGKE
jgi:hypothetical protein